MILADMLEVKDETSGAMQWRAIWGTTSCPSWWSRPTLGTAMEIYDDHGQKGIFWRAAVVDTEQPHARQPPGTGRRALAEEVTAGTDYAQAYTDFLLGRVIKCRDIDELRQHDRMGITRRLHALPQLYACSTLTRRTTQSGPVLAEDSRPKEEIRRLEEKLEKLEKQRMPLEETPGGDPAIWSFAMDYLDRPRRRVLEHDQGYPDDQARRKRKEKCCRAG